MKWKVTCEATCSMIVIVEAESAAEAKRIAKAGDYEPWTQWDERRGFRPIEAEEAAEDFDPLA